MAAKEELSKEMQRALDILKEHGTLVRYKGGFWNVPDCTVETRRAGGLPYEVPIHPEIIFFGATTIKGLHKRKLIEPYEYDPQYNLPCAYKLIENVLPQST